MRYGYLVKPEMAPKGSLKRLRELINQERDTLNAMPVGNYKTPDMNKVLDDIIGDNPWGFKPEPTIWQRIKKFFKRKRNG